MGNSGRWQRGVFIRCHHFNHYLCRVLGPGGTPLVVGQACPMVGCGAPNLVQPHPPQCKLLPELDAWPVDLRTLSEEGLAAFLAAADAELPALARALGFADLNALEAHARADEPGGGMTRSAAMAACVAELTVLHAATLHSIPADTLNASTPPEVMPSADPAVPRGNMEFLAFCLANYGKRGNRTLDCGSWALTALMARCVGTPVGAMGDVFSVFREEQGMGAAAEPKSAEALAHATGFAGVIAKHAASGAIGLVEVMGATPRALMQTALRRNRVSVADASAAVLKLAEVLATLMEGGPPAGAMSQLVGANQADFCSSAKAFFAAVFCEHSTRAHYQHIANLDVGGGVSYSLAMLDCDRIFNLVVAFLLARLRGVAAFDLRAEVAKMGSPRAVDGSGSGWAGISLEVLRSTQIAFQEKEAADALVAALADLASGAPDAAAAAMAAAAAYTATGASNRARFEALAALEAGPGFAGDALVAALANLASGAPDAAAAVVAGAAAYTAAAESGAVTRHEAPARARRLRRSTRRTVDGVEVEFGPFQLTGREVQRWSLLDELIARDFTFATITRPNDQWCCGICEETGESAFDRRGETDLWQPSHAWRHVKATHGERVATEKPADWTAEQR